MNKELGDYFSFSLLQNDSEGFPKVSNDANSFSEEIRQDLQSRSKTLYPKQLFENSLLNYKEAAEYLSISESYLRRLKRKGKLPFVHMGRRGIRFKVASLDAWVAEREVKK